jgi:hypothetical protein
LACVLVFAGSIFVGYHLFAHDGESHGSEWPRMEKLVHRSIANLHYHPAARTQTKEKSDRGGGTTTTGPGEEEPPAPLPEEGDTSPTPSPQNSPTPPPEEEEPVHEE